MKNDIEPKFENLQKDKNNEKIQKLSIVQMHNNKKKIIILTHIKIPDMVIIKVRIFLLASHVLL